MLVLTLTDGRLAEGSFVTQSLLILVEDINDNTVMRPKNEPMHLQITIT